MRNAELKAVQKQSPMDKKPVNSPATGMDGL